jgi:hypothetical protein
MTLEEIPITKLKRNEANPRVIKGAKLEKLKESIKEFPEMLKIRPIVVDENYMILGGNMRFQACKELGLQKTYVVKAEGLTDSQRKEFIVKDNVAFGEWDFDILQKWDEVELESWGMETWFIEDEPDYGVLDDEETDAEIEEMQKEVKKAVLIDFKPEDYREALDMIKKARTEGKYVGGILLQGIKNMYDAEN